MESLSPFILEHQTPEEGSPYKVHIYSWGKGKTLCGLNSDNHHCSSATPETVNVEWLENNKGYEHLCRKCEKSALNQVSTPPGNK